MAGAGLARASLERPPAQHTPASRAVPPSFSQVWVGGAWYQSDVSILWPEKEPVLCGHIPAWFRAAGYTLPRGAQGFSAGLCMMSHATVLTCKSDAAQDRTVYKAPSHVLPHASPVTVLGGRYSYPTDGGDEAQRG